MLLCIILEAIVLNTTNTNILKFENPEKPLFLWFFSPYCPHCNAFKPAWKNLIDNKEVTESVDLVSINCAEFVSECKSFKITGYPSFIYYNPIIKKSINYDEQFKYDHILSFIKKQLQFPILEVDSEDEIMKKQKEVTNFSSLFAILHKDTDGDLLKIFTQVSKSFYNSNAYFVSCLVDKTEIRVYRDRTSDFEVYDGNYSYDSISKFISERSLPYLPPLQSNIYYEGNKNGALILFFMLSNDYYDDYSQLAKSLKDTIQSIYIGDEHDYMVNFMNIKPSCWPAIVLTDLKNNRWIRYKGNHTYSEIKQWISDVNKSDVKWEGPGNGLFSSFFVKLYSVRAMDRNAYYVLIVMLFFVIFCLLFVCYQVNSLYYTDDYAKKPIALMS